MLLYANETKYKQQTIDHIIQSYKHSRGSAIAESFIHWVKVVYTLYLRVNSSTINYIVAVHLIDK